MLLLILGKHPLLLLPETAALPAVPTPCLLLVVSQLQLVEKDF